MKFFKTKSVRIMSKVVLFVFAGIGFLFFSVFVGMRFHLTDVKGSIDSRNKFFNDIKKVEARLPALANNESNSLNFNKLDPVIECKIMTINSVLPINGQRILDTYISTKSPEIAERMIKAIVIVTHDNNPFVEEKINKCEEVGQRNFIKDNFSNQSIFSWMVTPEWITLRDALVKDKDVINQAAKDSGIPARVIVSTVISEQFRFFTDNRESFKKYFEPLKILGNGTKFSYGVAGVKVETAKNIEKNLKDKESPFYLGPQFENIFDYGDKDPNTELMTRLANDNDHYYSYLYTAIFLRQIMHQWEMAGYPVYDRPEVLATLFNLGFNKSLPKENPEVGGSTITINDRDYTFGGLSYEFYYSGELSDIFPFEVQ